MTCAVLSLQHAMLLLGHPVAFGDIQRRRPLWKRPFWEGIDGIARLARSFGFHPQRVQTACFGELRQEIDRALTAGMPIIVGVEDIDHWAVLAGRSGRHYVSVDSADSPAFRVRSWPEIREWYGQEDDGDRWLEAIAVGPRKDGAVASLVPAIRRYVRILNGQKTLRERWGKYLHALLSAGFLATGRTDGARFLRGHSEQIVEAMAEGGLRRAAAARILGDLLTVAAAHRLGAPGTDAGRAIGKIAQTILP
ncbi:MAG TPA: hypothetical protein PLU30_12830 [Verrucomicrobiae bacterium]|nr:hypothetical protein [Verrucomicrobiae bacterium]